MSFIYSGISPPLFRALFCTAQCLLLPFSDAGAHRRLVLPYHALNVICLFHHYTFISQFFNYTEHS
nr:MAG TPA: hypothetical protein [Caudoviricetes sp.]